MAEVPIYTLNLAAADFSYTSPAYYSSAWGGSSTPNASYPEFGQIENVHRAEAAGASGQDVIDAVNTADYTTSWITMCGIGSLASGQFDARGGGAGKPLKLRWKQFLKSSALAETGYLSVIALANGGPGGTGNGLSAGNVFLQVQMQRSSGAAFHWYVDYMSVNGSSFLQRQINGDLTGAPGTADNAEHAMLLTYTPSTVTGAYTSSTDVGSAVVASDGSFDLTMGGVSVIAGSGLQMVVNKYVTTNPALYYGKTLWFGD